MKRVMQVFVFAMVLSVMGVQQSFSGPGIPVPIPPDPSTTIA
jgi:hypothetical protein